VSDDFGGDFLLISDLGIDPIEAAVSPDGTKVYVTNLNGNTVSVIARPGNTVVATIPVGTFPVGP
jgi:YVTN family beta-propeller protein